MLTASAFAGPAARGANSSPLALLGRLPMFAHHATCARYDHHLLRPFGVPLCLGCVCMYSGIAVTSAILFFFVGIHLPGDSAVAGPSSMPFVLSLYAGSLACCAPTFMQPFVQRRWFKIPARLILGAGLTLSGWAVLSAPWTTEGHVARAVFLLVTYTLYRLAQGLRAKKLDNPCSACPWGAFPLCAHNLPALRTMLAKPDLDPEQRVFFEALVAQLEPLAQTTPRLGAVPDATGPVHVGFISLRADLSMGTPRSRVPLPMGTPRSRVPLSRKP